MDSHEDSDDSLLAVKSVEILMKNDIKSRQKKSSETIIIEVTSDPEEEDKEVASDPEAPEENGDDNVEEGKDCSEEIIIQVTGDPKQVPPNNSDDESSEDPIYSTDSDESVDDTISHLTSSGITLKCKNKNCTFTCKDVKLLTKHSKRCGKKPKESSNDIKIRPWYKCCLCKAILKNRESLSTHAQVHAREEGDLFLKVNFKKYIEGVFQNVVVKTAKPLFKPPPTRKPQRSKPTDPKQKNRPKKGVKDPNRILLGCNECNFKTHVSEEILKHKKLHWNPNKDELFKSQKWFTCNICYFYTFDKERYLEHFESHENDIKNKIIHLPLR